MKDDRHRGRGPGGKGGPPRGRSGGSDFGSKPLRPNFRDDRPARKREGGDWPSRGRRFDDRPPRRFDDQGDERKPFRKRADRDRPQFRPRPQRDEQDSVHAGERIAKAMARAGLCSRRDAEEWIAEGRVSVNGAVIDSPALNITAADKVLVDGEPLPERERTRLWLYHKPAGLVTTASDPEGRPTVFQNLPEDLPRVMSIGRLDINTEGLLLLTNDGGLARVLAHPETGWLRRYRVRAHGEIDQTRLDALRHGIVIDGVTYEPIHATLDRVQGRNVWLTLDLREGKNREVKVVLEHLGLMVNRLIRVSFGPFQLGDIREGDVEEVRTRLLKEQLGERLAAEAGVDFDGPRKAARIAHQERSAARPRFDKRREPGRFDRDRGERSGPKRFVGERRRDADRDPTRGRILYDEADIYAPPPGERSRKPAERNVYRDDDVPPKPRRKRPDREEFAARRRAAALGEDRNLTMERSETADRAGRRVRVERIRGPREDERPPSKGFRRHDDNDRRPPRKDDDRPPLRFRRDDDRPRGEAGERPFRKSRFEGSDERSARRFGRSDRPPGRFDDRDSKRKPFRGKSPPRERERAGGFDGKPRGRKSGSGGFRGGRPGGKPPGGGRSRRT